MIQALIEEKLKALEPVHLDVVNESFMHGVPPGSETHFKIVVVSRAFEGQMLLKRHRAVNALITEEMARVRAIALHTFTPAEWETRQGDAPRSPGCVGSSKGS